MPIELTPDLVELIDGPNIAHLATVRPDGDPSVVAVWLGRDGDHLVVCTGRRSRKTRNAEHYPHVALSITSHANPYACATIRGTVIEVRNDDDLALMDPISRTYIGDDFPFREGERVALIIEPTHAEARILPFAPGPGAG